MVPVVIKANEGMAANMLPTPWDARGRAKEHGQFTIWAV
jgi:hypothetical protein